MYIIGGFDGQRLNDMHHISLPWSNNDDKNLSMVRRRGSSRPFSSTSGFIQPINEFNVATNSPGGQMSSALSSENSSENLNDTADQIPQNTFKMQKKIKRL